MKFNTKKSPYASSVDVWSFKDDYLQPEQLQRLSRQIDYLCVYNLRTNAFITLESDTNRIESSNFHGGDDYLLASYIF